KHPWKSDGNSAFMSAAFGNTFKGDLKNMMRCYTANRTEPFQGIAFNPGIKLFKFLICQSGICFCESDQFSVIPKSKGIIGEKIGSSSMSPHSISQNSIDGKRIGFPFPPVSFFSTDQIS